MNERNETQIQVGLARLYVKDVSFESPNTPAIFRKQLNPEVHVKVNVTPRKVDAGFYEVSLELTVEAKSGGEVDFIVEVEHAGLFEIQGVEGAQLDNVLQVFCPSTIFPYARQVIDSMLLQGGLPPLMLAPVNFDAVRRQRVAKTPN